MNYIGSKRSLLPFLETRILDTEKKKRSFLPFLRSSILRAIGVDRRGVFCDLFAGTGIVGSHFKELGYRIISNDLQHYSYVLNQHYIGNSAELAFEGLRSLLPNMPKAYPARAEYVCDYLMGIEGQEGFVYQNYCHGGTKDSDEPRLYFSDANGMKCDAIRTCIGSWHSESLISDGEYYFLLTSLLEAIDKCANTASVYGAFLKQLKKTALKDLHLKPALLIKSDKTHVVYNEDSNALIDRIECDILYLDPPYNSRQYASNYHLLETIACYDSPSLRGKTGLRDNSQQSSQYCSKIDVANAFKDLILRAKARYIFLSYNNEGLMDLATVREIMSLRGEYGIFKTSYNRFKADKDGNRNYKSTQTEEYLHYVICDK